MKTNKILLSLFTLLTIVFFGCKEDETEFYALNIDNKEIFQNETYKFYVENYQGSITWSIDDDRIASIDQNGQVKGLRVGTTFVHAYLSNGMHFMSFLTVSQSALKLPFEALQISTTKDYNNPIPTKFILEVGDSTYIDTTSTGEVRYPLHVTLTKLQDQSSSLKNETEEERELLETTITYKLRTAEEKGVAGYNIEVIPGEEAAKYYCKLELGPYYIDFNLTVSYGVYLSYSDIDPKNLNEGINLSATKTLVPKDEGPTIPLTFFCYLDDATPEQVAKVKQQIMDKESYKFEDLNMVIGDITIDESRPVWQVNVPLTVETEDFQSGTVTLSIEDKDLVLDLTVDDGTYFKELYVSFESIYTYSEDTKLNSRTLDNAYFSYIGGEDPEKGIGDVITMVVYYSMTPDNRGDFIEWAVKVPEDAPVKYIGKQKINTQQFEFDFEVVKAGASTIEITVQNPKADDPKLTRDEKELYEEYRFQTLSALVDVKDRASVNVDQVLFLSDESSDSDPITEKDVIMKTENLYAYVLPEDAAGAWQPKYSIKCFDGADAEVTQIGYSEEMKEEIAGFVTIKHAGKIVVTATAKDKTATLTLHAKMAITTTSEDKEGILTLKQQTSGDYAPGQTDKIIPTLKSNFTVYASEYSWTSSNTGVVEVDAEGNITAIADGTATITASIEDEFGHTETETIEIKVRTVNASVNFDDPKFVDHYVVQLRYATGEIKDPGMYYIDLPEVGPEELLYTLTLINPLSEKGEGAYLSENGVYEVGTHITGIIEFPSGDKFDIVGGTITVSDEGWTFNLQISNDADSGTVTGTKPYTDVVYEE